MGASILSCYIPAPFVGNHQGFLSTATTTDLYSHGQDALPVALNEPALGIALNGADNQLDPSSLNGLPDQGVHRMPPSQITDPSKQFPFTEGPGIESFTFGEVYNGLGIKDADTVDTDEESLWQVSWCTFPYGKIYHMYKA
jgi:hypothetical protein